MTDVKLFQTADNGDIDVTGGVMALDEGFDTAIYLSLFGGNEEDPGNVKSDAEWWGNGLEKDENKKYRSKTQHLINSLPATSANLNRIKQAVKDDLAWMLQEKMLSDLTVFVTIPGVNKIKINVVTEVTNYEYLESWDA